MTNITDMEKETSDHTISVPRLTRDAIRDLRPGETRTYRLPSVPLCESARSTAYAMQHHLKCRITARADYGQLTVTVTRRRDPEEGAGR